MYAIRSYYEDRCGDLPIGALGDISQVTAVEPEAPAGATCDDPVKVGLVTDGSGPLAIYGAHILRSFPLGLEYASGSAGSQVADDQWTFTVDNCEVESYNFV